MVFIRGCAGKAVSRFDFAKSMPTLVWVDCKHPDGAMHENDSGMGIGCCYLFLICQAVLAVGAMTLLEMIETR